LTDKLQKLIENLDKTGIEVDGQNLQKVKDRIKKIKVPLNPLGFYVLVKVEKVEQFTESGIMISSDDLTSREQEANSKGWILAFGPTCYRGFAGPGEDGMCAGPEDWGLEIGDYVEFQSYNGKVSAFEDTGDSSSKQKTLRLVPDSNIICKVEI